MILHLSSQPTGTLLVDRPLSECRTPRAKRSCPATLLLPADGMRAVARHQRVLCVQVPCRQNVGGTPRPCGQAARATSHYSSCSPPSSCQMGTGDPVTE